MANKLATVAANIARAAGRKKIPTEKMAKALNPKSRASVIPSSKGRPLRPTPSARTIGKRTDNQSDGQFDPKRQMNQEDGENCQTTKQDEQGREI